MKVLSTLGETHGSNLHNHFSLVRQLTPDASYNLSMQKLGKNLKENSLDQWSFIEKKKGK